MLLDLKPMLRGEITRLPVDFRIEPEAPVGVELTGDAHIEGEITNQAAICACLLPSSSRTAAFAPVASTRLTVCLKCRLSAPS